MRNFKSIWIVLAASVLAFTLPASADTCNSFASFTCPTKGGTPDIVNFGGTGTTGQSVGILLGNSTFSININSNHSFAGDDLVILAAFPSGMAGSVGFSGSVSSVAFTSTLSFPEGGAIGAIQSTWSGLGISATNVQFGYANLGAIGSTPIQITASGVPNGTILYGEIVNPTTKQILYITPNSEAGVYDGNHPTVPEPDSLALMGTGLVGLAGVLRRKLGK